MLVAVAHPVDLAGTLKGNQIAYDSTSNPPNGGIATAHDIVALGAGSTAAQSVVNQIDSQFPGHWSAQEGFAVSGTITIDPYGVIQDPNDPDLIDCGIKATYSGPGSYQWVQMIDTNDPLDGDTNPTIDTNNNQPFYPTTTDGGATMLDAAKRTKPTDPHLQPGQSADGYTTHFTADLFLVSVGAPGTVVIHDGFSWGFDLAPYGISAVSVNPAPEPSTLACLLSGACVLMRRRRSGSR